MQFKQDLKDVIVAALGQPQDPHRPKWCCPFHNDKRPSLVILPRTDRYPKEKFFCRSCDAKGDVADFISRFHGIPLARALDSLSSSGGILPESPPQKRLYVEFVGGLQLPTSWLFPVPNDKPMIGITRDWQEVEIPDSLHPGQTVSLRLPAPPSEQERMPWCYLHDVENDTKRWRVWQQQYRKNCLLAAFHISPIFKKPLPEASYDELLSQAVETL